MARLNHNPEEEVERFPEGIYNIRVKHIEFPYTFGSGNTGMKLLFDVWNSDGVGFENRENVVTSLATTKWKLKELCYALGVDYDNEDLDSDDFLGKEGKAQMVREPGSKWLKVDSYLSVDSVDSKTDTKSVDSKEEVVPF